MRKLAKTAEQHQALMAADKLHSACVYLARQFSVEMAAHEAQANVDARTMLLNCSSEVLDSTYDLEGLTAAGGYIKLRVVRRVQAGKDGTHAQNG